MDASCPPTGAGCAAEAVPALRRDLLAPPDLARLEPSARADHPPRILLLYDSLRERSYSRLLTEEAARLLRVLAVPMAGGMVSSTVLTLPVIPALDALVRGWHLPRGLEASARRPRRIEPHAAE